MTSTHITIGLVIALLIAFAFTYRAGKNAGIDQTEAFYQRSMNESVAAMQRAMADMRTASRKQLEQRESELQDARERSQEAWKQLGKNNAKLQKCLPVDVPVSAIWLQQ